MRVGIIGFGYWGSNVVRNFVSNPGVTSVTVCDLESSRLEKAKRLFPSIQTTTSVDSMMQSKDIDAIAIVTPVKTHFALAKQALENGKHVLVEKPMTFSVEEARALISLAEKKNLKLAVDHTFIYTPAVRKLKELITNGTLGELWYFDSVRINLGLFQHDVNVIWDLAAHDLAILIYLTGRVPLEVAAQGSAHSGSGMEDIAYITLRYADNFIAHFHVNWLAPVKLRQVIIGGSEKMAVWDDLNPSEKIKVYDKGIVLPKESSNPDEIGNVLIKYRTGDVYSPSLDGTEALTTLVTHFIACIQGKETLLTPGLQGLQVVGILEATQKSLRNGGQLVPVNYHEL
jgi:predicted dehydrogenase